MLIPVEGRRLLKGHFYDVLITDADEFDMNFVYSAWAPELDGEKVFFADNIEELQRLVKSGDISEMDYVHYSEDDEKPFGAEWDCGC